MKVAVSSAAFSSSETSTPYRLREAWTMRRTRSTSAAFRGACSITGSTSCMPPLFITTRRLVRWAMELTSSLFTPYTRSSAWVISKILVSVA